MADLTTLERVKQYLAISSNGTDAVIQQLIPVESRTVERYTSRVFPAVTRTARRLNGTGTPMQTLPDSPIISVASVAVGAITLTQSPGAQSPTGYTWDETTLYLTDGTVFTRGLQNLTATWTAGYAGTETDAIPAGNTPTLQPDSGSDGSPGAGLALVNVSVTAADGTVFTEVANSPAAGQYSFSPGTYTFNSGDVGTEVTMAYYLVPAPVEHAVIELIGIDIKQRPNLGQKSQVLNGQQVNFEHASLPSYVKDLLNPYRRMAPV